MTSEYERDSHADHDDVRAFLESLTGTLRCQVTWLSSD